ncbi:hypothetical protein HAX54_028336 [Datura stramonium]|uniref:Uncharacterized protein n=1 Tax=Datura stramonium TaxID=4076 RepID=A0ABS8S9I0_DATST|nr:hypothetical protein [Datura stramonium]
MATGVGRTLLGATNAIKCRSIGRPVILFLILPLKDLMSSFKELRERCKEIPDGYFVALVGDMITEVALPTYQTMLTP